MILIYLDLELRLEIHSVFYKLTAHPFLIIMFTALKGSKFYFYLLLLQLVLCLVAALKVSPYIIYSADYIFLLVLEFSRGFLRNQKFIGLFGPLWIILVFV